MEMVEVRTEALTGAALDWAVAKAADVNVRFVVPYVIDEHNQPAVLVDDGDPLWVEIWQPSRDWSQAGPLIEKYDVSISHACTGYWASAQIGIRANGDTRLIAACRAIVAANLGDTVQVPAELTR